MSATLSGKEGADAFGGRPVCFDCDSAVETLAEAASWGSWVENRVGPWYEPNKKSVVTTDLLPTK